MILYKVSITIFWVKKYKNNGFLRLRGVFFFLIQQIKNFVCYSIYKNTL